jgi:hypothetical protein
MTTGKYLMTLLSTAMPPKSVILGLTCFLYWHIWWHCFMEPSLESSNENVEVRSATKLGMFTLHISMFPPTAAWLSKFPVLPCYTYFSLSATMYWVTVQHWTSHLTRYNYSSLRKHESYATLWHIFLWFSSVQTSAGAVSCVQRQRLPCAVLQVHYAV